MERTETRTHQAFEMLMAVHIRHFDYERWEAVLVHHGFDNILRGLLPIIFHEGYQRVPLKELIPQDRSSPSSKRY